MCKAWRYWWSVLTGERRRRRERIARKRLIMALEREERRLIGLQGTATGREAIACVNDLYLVRQKRRYLLFRENARNWQK